MLVCETTTYKATPSGELRESHLRFIRGCGDQGKVLMSGRFADAQGALIIWKVDSMEEAKNLAAQDPYVKNDAVVYELREWPATFDYTTSPPTVPPA